MQYRRPALTGELPVTGGSCPNLCCWHQVSVLPSPLVCVGLTWHSLHTIVH